MGKIAFDIRGQILYDKKDALKITFYRKMRNQE